MTKHEVTPQTVSGKLWKSVGYALIKKDAVSGLLIATTIREL
jgi:hypothetical protein